MFAEHLYTEVLEDVPHRHLIFTIPKRIRCFFRYDRALHDILFKAANSALSSVLLPQVQDGSLAAVLTLQTFGNILQFNPHLHGILANGLFLPDGSFSPFDVINETKLLEVFTDNLLGALHKKELIDDDVIKQILSQEHSGFSVWLGEPFRDESSAKFLARYIERAPFSLEKLSFENDKVLYSTDDETLEFDPLEFLALLSAQIPVPYESLTRYFGHYSCRARGERKKKLLLHDSDDIAQADESLNEISTPSSWWAYCMKKIYEFDPLLCPKCSESMRILSFITDPHQALKIMDSLGLPRFRAPPKINKNVLRLNHLDDDFTPETSYDELY